MKYGRMVLVATVAALAGSGPSVQAQAMKAHADIKGDGITGRVELVERRQGTGIIVDVTVTASGQALAFTASICTPSASAKRHSPAPAATSIQPGQQSRS